MGIVRDIITPILPVVLGIAIGAGGSQAWGWYRYTNAIQAELAGRSQRDALVAALTVAQQERIKAEQAAGAVWKGAGGAKWKLIQQWRARYGRAIAALRT